MDEQEHDIVVHFKNSIFTINGVDPDRYCCIDMIIDVLEVTNVFMGDSLLNVMIAITVYRPYVGSPVGLPPPPDEGIGEEPNSDEIDDNEPNGENDVRDANMHEVDDVNGDEHIGVGGENDDNIYGFNSEDEDCIVDGDDVPNVRYAYNDDTINTQLDENSDDGFSGYQSMDECYVSSIDSEELKAEVNETHRRGRKRKLNVSDTSKFRMEFNVPEDGNTD
ncbi:unnamed protein product [Ilex paraguariensis]|uniref:Uncharacterized protein n=1 Tax=Ilex paraguariensis TaxID=185542 RepID=A0ABC8UZN5_9AQUA